MHDAEARRPLGRDGAAESAVDRERHRHRADGPEARERHVLVRVPDVALRAETGDAEVATEYQGRAPLEKLVAHRGRPREVERQEVAPETAHVDDAQEDLADRIGEQLSVREVDP